MFAPINTEAPPAVAYTKRYDYDVDGNLIYEGWAQSAIGLATSAAVWAVRRHTYASGKLTVSEWASGRRAEKFKWDDRGTLTYA